MNEFMKAKRAAYRRMRIAREQADQLIATHLMGWEIRKEEADDDGGYHQLYYKGDKCLGHTDSYEFHPSESISDAFWVIDTLSVQRDIFFVIDTNVKKLTEVKAVGQMGSDYGIFGQAASAPLAVAKALLDLIDKDAESGSPVKETVADLIIELSNAESETLQSDEQNGWGIYIDLDSYYPQ